MVDRAASAAEDVAQRQRVADDEDRPLGPREDAADSPARAGSDGAGRLSPPPARLSAEPWPRPSRGRPRAARPRSCRRAGRSAPAGPRSARRGRPSASSACLSRPRELGHHAEVDRDRRRAPCRARAPAPRPGAVRPFGKHGGSPFTRPRAPRTRSRRGEPRIASSIRRAGCDRSRSRRMPIAS